MRVKEAKAQPLESTTGTQAALPGAETLTAVTPRAGHPTLNTKPLFKLMVEKKASDLFFTPNAPIKIKIEGQILPVNRQDLPLDLDLDGRVGGEEQVRGLLLHHQLEERLGV